MKRMFYLFILLFVVFVNSGLAQTKNLDSLSEKKRNEYLKKEAAKEMKKLYPDFNTKDYYVKIERRKLADNVSVNEKMGYYPARVFYIIIYFKDKHKPQDYYVTVQTWEDTGLVFGIQYKDGRGFLIDPPKK